MTPHFPTLLPLLVGALLSGCAYLDAKQNTAAGGRQEQQIQQADADLASAQAQGTTLKASASERQQAIASNDARIRTLEADLRKQDARLKQALAARKVSQERYAQLKGQLDALQADSQAAGKSPGSGGDAVKEAKLQDLEKRKKALEAALTQLVPPQ